MRLWIRLSIALAVVAVLPLLILTFFATERAQKESDRSNARELEFGARMYATQVTQWTSEQANFLDGWSQLYFDRLHLLSADHQEGLLRAIYVAMPSSVVVALVDADGLAVVQPFFTEASGNRPVANGRRAQQLIDRLPISEALSGQGVVLGDPYLPEGAAGLPSVPIAVRAADGVNQGEPLILGAEVSLTILESAERREEYAHVLLDRGGAVLHVDDPTWVVEQLLRPLIQTSTHFSYEHPKLGAVQGASAPMELGWTFFVLSRASTVPFPLLYLSVGFLMIAVSVWAANWLAGWISDPIATLRDSFLRVADGDYGRSADAGRTDEIGELARAFNHMSERLAAHRKEIQGQQQEIEAFNVELQDRVERRTRELRDAQDQLVHSGQLAAVAEVGAGLAHELNNPLAGILGIAQLLRGKRGGNPDDGLLGDIEEQAARCREVVATMLRFSSGEVDHGRAPVVDLRDVLVDVCKLVRGPFRQRGVALDLIESEHPLKTRVDPLHGSRILVQILNALRAGLREGSTLRIVARVNQGQVEVELRPDDIVAVDDLRRDDWMAAGMGMWVARRMLHDLGGRLEQPVRLPTHGTQLYTEESSTPPLPPLTVGDMRWLVVFPEA
jgi:two-component system, NtrC family, sensor kinase